MTKLQETEINDFLDKIFTSISSRFPEYFADLCNPETSDIQLVNELATIVEYLSVMEDKSSGNVEDTLDRPLSRGVVHYFIKDRFLVRVKNECKDSSGLESNFERVLNLPSTAFIGLPDGRQLQQKLNSVKDYFMDRGDHKSSFVPAGEWKDNHLIPRDPKDFVNGRFVSKAVNEQAIFERVYAKFNS